MPDPLSIVTGVTALLQATWTVGVELKKFHDGVSVVHQSIRDLQQDVDGLERVLESMRDTFATITAEQQTGTGHVASHWSNIARAIEDGKGILSQLQQQVEEISKTKKFLDGPRKQLRINMSEEKLAGFRVHIQSYRDGLQLSLQTIILWNQVSYQKSADLVLPSLNDLHRDVRRIALDLNQRIEALQNTVQTQQDEAQVVAMSNLRDCVKSAASIVSSASTVVASQKGDEARTTVPASDFGDCFPVEQNLAIRRWIEARTVYEYDETASQLAPQSVADVRALDDSEESSGSDSDLDNEMTDLLLESGKQKLSAGDNKGAVKTFRNCLNRLPTLTTNSREKHIEKHLQILAHLYDIYKGDKNYSDAQKVLMQRMSIKERVRKKDVEYTHDIYRLALLLHNKQDFVEAQLQARKALKAYKKLGHDGSTRDCLQLLISLCEVTKNDDDREVYAIMLKRLGPGDIKAEQLETVSSRTTTSFKATESQMSTATSPISSGGTERDSIISRSFDPTPSSLDAPQTWPTTSRAETEDTASEEVYDEATDVADAEPIEIPGRPTADEVAAARLADEEALSSEPALQVAPVQSDIIGTPDPAVRVDSQPTTETLPPGVHIEQGDADEARERLQREEADEAVAKQLQQQFIEEEQARRKKEQEIDRETERLRELYSIPSPEQPPAADFSKLRLAESTGDLASAAFEKDQLREDLAHNLGVATPKDVQTQSGLVRSVSESDASSSRLSDAASSHTSGTLSTARTQITIPSLESLLQDDPLAMGSGSAVVYRQHAVNHDSQRDARPAAVDGWPSINSSFKSIHVTEYTVWAGQVHFIVECQLQHGTTRNLKRTYTEFYDLSVALRLSYKHDIHGRRILPYLPPPINKSFEHTAKHKKTSLDVFCQELLEIPNCFLIEPVRKFLAFRDTTDSEFYVDPINGHVQRKVITPHSLPKIITTSADASTVYELDATEARPNQTLNAATLAQASGEQRRQVSRVDDLANASVVSLAGTEADTVSGRPESSAKKAPAHKCKLVVVGDGGCGKTYMEILFTKGFYPEVMINPAWDIFEVDREIDGKQVEVKIQDTPGQEDYDRLRPLLYPDTHCVLICFAIDSPDSLDNVFEKWTPEILHFLPGVPILLVGCQEDLRHDPQTIEELKKTSQRPVTKAEAQEYRVKIGAFKYMECSSRNNEGVNDVFDQAIRAALLYQNKKAKTHKKRRSVFGLFSSSS